MKMRKRDIIALAIFGAIIFGRMGYKAYRQLQGPPVPSVTLEQARADHPTQLIRSANHQTGPLPAIFRTDVLEYTSYEGPLGTMEAIGTPIAEDGQLSPAVVWVTGGFGGLFYGIDHYGDPKNDQGIASFWIVTSSSSCLPCAVSTKARACSSVSSARSTTSSRRLSMSPLDQMLTQIGFTSWGTASGGSMCSSLRF